jgi:hypothetical protein
LPVVACGNACVLNQRMRHIPRMSHEPQPGELDCQLGKSVALSICHLQIP